VLSFAVARTEPRNRRVALIAGAMFVGSVVIAFPFAGLPLPEIPAFVPMFGVFACGADALTAYLLFTHERTIRYPPLTVLGGAFVFSAVIAVAQALAFPGAFTAAGIFDVNGQTAVWLWGIWHVVFPCWIVAYAVVDRRWARSRAGAGGRAWGMLFAGLGGFAALLAVPVAMAFASGMTVLQGEDFSPGLRSGAYLLVVAANVAALAAVAIRFREGTLLQLWVLVAVVATACDVALTVFGGHARFSLGWYAGRVFTLIASSALLGFLIAELNAMYARAARLAGVDGLTGIPNRRAHEERLEAAYRTAQRTGRPFALIMFDVDHFKRYNDVFGHLAGDDALRAIAAAARASLGRSADAVARYGGEEFAVVLPETTALGAQVVAERIRLAVVDLRLPHAPGSAADVVTVSVGCAAFEPDRLESASDVRSRADQALYRAKGAGRNCVELDGSAR